MSIPKKEYKRVTVRSVTEMKQNGEKISMLTAYDYSMAKIVDAANVDVILVGDSASNVMAGHETTLPITLDQMIYHASSVIRAVQRALVVVDLPFGSYQSDPKEALRSAIRIMKESGAHAVKLEGGAEIKESVKRILAAGIPVMGHLGSPHNPYINLEPIPCVPRKNKRRKNFCKTHNYCRNWDALVWCWKKYRRHSPRRSRKVSAFPR